MKPGDLERAVQALKQGQLVAFPTETVYGLGADASNLEALKHLYRVKGRPGDHPVIVHLASAEQMPRWARQIPPQAWALARRFWPGPLTLILPRANGVSDRITGGQDTVGLRVPGHPIALMLLEAFGGGVAAPSANRFGSLSPTTAQHVLDDLGPDVAVVLDGGPCPVGIESTIVDLAGESPRILRPGILGAHHLQEILGVAPPTGGPTRAPGTLSRHYSPRTPVRLVASQHLEAEFRRLLDSGAPGGVLAFRKPLPQARPEGWIQAPADPKDYARQLYASLRTLDALGLPLILVEEVPGDPGWDGVRDRLRRAAAAG